MKRALHIMGYVSFFFTCFIMASVLTFPLSGLRPLAVAEAEKALGKGKKGKSGVDPVVTIGDISMSGLGVMAKRVTVQLGNTEPEPGPTIELDSVWVSASLLSLVSDNKTLQLKADLYKGDVDAEVTIDPKQNVTAVDVKIDGVALGSVGAIIAAAGVPVEGTLNADIDVVLGAAAEKDAKGNIDVRIEDLAIGQGSLKLMAGFTFELDNGVTLGNLVLKAPVDKGQGTLTLGLEGATDVDAEAAGTITLRGKLPQSRLDVDGYFKPTAPFLDKNTKIKSAMELGEQLVLGKAKDSDGRYHFLAKGALQTLRPQLARDNGRRSRATKSSPPAAADAKGADGAD
jgi:type II secretion system protein N